MLSLAPRLAALLLLLMVWPAHAQEAPPAARALVRDLDRLVALQEQSGWGMDYFEFEAMLPMAMRSICRAPADLWPATDALLDAEVLALGGDPEAAFEAAGRDLGAVEDLLSAWRARELFRAAQQHTARCPFWMAQNAAFLGLHSDEGRWSLHLEGGGLLVARLIDKEFRLGGGGGGRMTVGHGLSESWDLRMGVGFGSSALADKSVETENVAVDFYVDAPVVLRHSNVVWRQEIEVAPVATGVPWLAPMQFGVRVGGLIGVGYLRVREVMPWVGLGVYAEYIFARSGLPETLNFRMGVRVGFSWSSVED